MRKKTITNVWQYIESLGEKSDKTIVRRILGHIMYYLMSGGDDPQYYNKVYYKHSNTVSDEQKINDIKSVGGVDLSKVIYVKSNPNTEENNRIGFIPVENVLENNGYICEYLKDIRTASSELMRKFKLEKTQISTMQ